MRSSVVPRAGDRAPRLVRSFPAAGVSIRALRGDAAGQGDADGPRSRARRCATSSARARSTPTPTRSSPTWCASSGRWSSELVERGLRLRPARRAELHRLRRPADARAHARERRRPAARTSIARSPPTMRSSRGSEGRATSSACTSAAATARACGIAKAPTTRSPSALFGGLEFDRLLLEYDTERAGGFEPLRFVPKGRIVVLGLITTKTGRVETVDELARRIDRGEPLHPARPARAQPAVRLRLRASRAIC